MLLLVFIVAITIAVLFSLIENISIVRTVINSRDGIVRECTLPFLVPRLGLLSLSQLQIKFTGMREIISTRLMKSKERWRLQFRNNLDEIKYKLYLLGNGIKRRDGPFLGERFGVVEAGAI